MIDKEKVIELVKDLMFRSTDDRVEITMEWLEQNQPAPIVVGLSDEQLRDFFVSSRTFANTNHFVYSYNEWAETQNFTQPEVKETVVGLSDEQVDEILIVFNKPLNGHYARYFKNYLETKTFPQPNQFEPNWDDAPPNTTCATVKVHYFDLEDTNIGWKTLSQVKRPQPTPKVEVGQVWKYANDREYVIETVGRLKNYENGGDAWFSCVTYRSLDDDEIYTRILFDFLAKFERVS